MEDKNGAEFEKLWYELSKPAEYCGVGVSVVDKSEAKKFFTAARLQGAKKQKERDAKIAEDVCGDIVQCRGGDEPCAVGKKIAAAIRKEPL